MRGGGQRRPQRDAARDGAGQRDFHREDCMERTTRTERLSPPRAARRRFLKQIAATGVVAGAAALPAMAQEKTEPRGSTLANGQASVAETLARYAVSLKYEDLP